jgi:hypothetical protein
MQNARLFEGVTITDTELARENEPADLVNGCEYIGYVDKNECFGKEKREDAVRRKA